MATKLIQRPAQLRDETRAAAHWLFGNGIPRAAIHGLAKRGDLQARLMSMATGGGEPWAIIEQIRAHGPVLSGELGFITADHAVVKEVLSSPDFRSGNPVQNDSRIGRLASWTASDDLHPLQPPSLLVTNGPTHTRYRKLVTRVFTVRAVEQLRQRTEEIASGLLDGLAGASETDLVATYCSQLPIAVIAEILGVPKEHHDHVLALGTGAAPSLDFGLSWSENRQVNNSLRGFDAWLDEHLTWLRRNPGDNLLSQLVEAHDEEVTLNERELKSIAGLVFAAGFETTVNLLGNGTVLLSSHPEQLDRLRREPSLWSNCVDEVLRLDPPVLLTGRTTDNGATVRGHRIPAGGQIVTLLAGANRDPWVFSDPETFDVARPNADQHISFSYGSHYCLGASLARMEGEVGLHTLFERFPDLQVLPGGRRRPTRVLRGWESLPVRLCSPA